MTNGNRQPQINLETIATETRTFRDTTSEAINISNISRTILFKELELRTELTGEAGGTLTNEQKEQYCERLSQAIINTMSDQVFKKNRGLNDGQIEALKQQKDRFEECDERSTYDMILDNYMQQPGFKDRCKKTIKKTMQDHGDIIPFADNENQQRLPNLLTNILNKEGNERDAQSGGLIFGPIKAYQRWFSQTSSKKLIKKLKDSGLDPEQYTGENEQHVNLLREYLNTHAQDECQNLEPAEYLTKYMEKVLAGRNPQIQENQ